MWQRQRERYKQTYAVQKKTKSVTFLCSLANDGDRWQFNLRRHDVVVCGRIRLPLDTVWPWHMSLELVGRVVIADTATDDNCDNESVVVETTAAVDGSAVDILVITMTRANQRTYTATFY